MTNRTINRILMGMGVVAALGLMGLAGNSDYEDAQAAAALYDQYVCEGVHPDYDQRGVECE